MMSVCGERGEEIQEVVIEKGLLEKISVITEEAPICYG